MVIGHKIKLYQKPKSREEFIKVILEHNDMEVVEQGVVPITIYSLYFPWNK